MKTNHVELWQRLKQFPLDSSEAALPFSARLARENNWPSTYALRVIAEYKRFAFLAVAAGHPVSPSGNVDEVWHLHLTYSENYWRVFCPEVLGKPLHHQPTKGGWEERGKFADWYRRTLESYREFFGEEPPCDIWPTPEERQRERHYFVRIDRERNWVIPKPRLLRCNASAWGLNSKAAAFIGLLALVMLCSGAMTAQSTNPFDWRGPDFLEFYVVLFACCFGAGLWLRRQWRQPVEDSSGTDYDLGGYEVAYLNGGKILTVNTALANLVNRKLLKVDGKGKRLLALGELPQDGHPLEHTIHNMAVAGGAEIGEVREAAKPVVADIVEGLKARGLVVADAPARKAVAIPLLLTLGVVGVGVVKICVGASRDKPVGFLAVLCLVSLVVSLVAFARRPLRSHYGDAMLKGLKERQANLWRPGRKLTGISSGEFAMVVGLFGMTALAGTELDPLRKSLQPPGGSGGCGSSCGGGCGGGGGGGCGGCGGD